MVITVQYNRHPLYLLILRIIPDVNTIHPLFEKQISQIVKFEKKKKKFLVKFFNKEVRILNGGVFKILFGP